MSDDTPAPTPTFRILSHDKLWLRDVDGRYAVFHVGAAGLTCSSGDAALSDLAHHWLAENDMPDPPEVVPVAPPKPAEIPDPADGGPTHLVRITAGGPFPADLTLWLRPFSGSSYATFKFCADPCSLICTGGNAKLRGAAEEWLQAQADDIEGFVLNSIPEPEPEPVEEPEPEPTEPEPVTSGVPEGTLESDTEPEIAPVDPPAPTSERDIDCDDCMAVAGEPCITPSGRIKDDFHAARRQDFAALSG